MNERTLMDEQHRQGHGHAAPSQDPIRLICSAAAAAICLAVASTAPAQHGGMSPVHPACGNTHVHQPLLDLLPHGQEDALAVQDGAWSAPATWGGTADADLPQPGDSVRIPMGVTVIYDMLDDGDGAGSDSTRFDTIRVDGTLSWSTERSTRLFVDTLFSSPTGIVIIGADAAPVPTGVTAEIVIIADQVMDPAADPHQLGRGVIPHGRTRIVGADKTDFAALAGDAHAGDTTLALAEPPVGWAAGDLLVLGGTFYDPAGSDADNSRFHDEVLEVVSVDGSTVTFTNTAPGIDGLRWDHARPNGRFFDPSDLTIYVANLTRNIVFRSELDPGSPELTDARLVPGTFMDTRRAHMMAMHTPDIVIRNSAWLEFGRLNKDEFINEPGPDVDGTVADSFAPIDGANQRGRYAIHLHRNLPRNNRPVDFDECEPSELTGNVVWGSPGWGFVHHDSYAIFEDNVAFDVLGAAFVQEAGNEIGRWARNISIKSTGDDDPEMTVEPFGQGYKRVTNFDFGFNGEGYWIQGASQVAFIDNVAVSAAGGGVQIFSDVDGNENRDASVVPREHLPATRQGIVTAESGLITVNRVPTNTFTGFEVINSDFGLITWNHMRNQGEWVGFVCPCDGNTHRTYALIDNFRFWNIYGQGIHLQYTSQATFRNGMILSSDLATPGLDDKPALDLGINGEGRGYGLGMNGPTKRLDIENVVIEGWRFGLRTPLEGELNALDAGDSVGSEGASGLPVRRSRFVDLKMASNDHHLYRRQNGFTEIQGFPNFLEMHGGDFAIEHPNTPPLADFTAETLGGVGVVHLSGLASRDSDTPGEGLPPYDVRTVATGDPNYIVAYGWDIGADGTIDLYGERVTVALPTEQSTRIALTVWDHQGATGHTTRTVHPQPTEPYPDAIVDGSFDTDDYIGGIYALSSAGASTGWFSARGTLENNQAVLRGQFLFSSIAQAIYDDFARRGEQILRFDLGITEGHTNPTPFEANDVTIRVFGINGEFAANHREATPRRDSAIPVEITPLFEERFEGEFAVTSFERTIDFGMNGFQYIFIGVQGEGMDHALPNDVAIVDNVSLTGSELPPPNDPCNADLDESGTVDAPDFLRVLVAYERSADGDIDGDGDTDGADFLLMLVAYGTPCG
ncbi:MAG: G8 domain-containing protein [Planctomycetota bacterium]